MVHIRKAVYLPLHHGTCPPWLFGRMKKIVGEIGSIIIDDYGVNELLRRLSSPMFFQALGCLAGFDWHSSGLTTTLCGALREGFKEKGLPIAICGGKGKSSLKTPEEIAIKAEDFGLSTAKTDGLIRASKLSARVDNNCIQDGYVLYHHVFMFDERGRWCVVQQGMNERNSYARRYHWYDSERFVEQPNECIVGIKQTDVLNLVSRESKDVRDTSLNIVREDIHRLIESTKLFCETVFPKRHIILKQDLSKRDWEVLKKAYELQPESYEELICLKGMGAKKLRALALLSKIIYGKEADWKDPVKYSFAHGGKDGIPYPVDKNLYDDSIAFLRRVAEKSSLDKRALKKLADVLG